MFERLTPTVRTLLIANLAMFAAQTFFGERLFAPLELWPWHSALFYGGPPFEPWQLLTYGFLHQGFLHVFFNMFALYMLGPEVEQVLGSARFRIFYLVCLIGAGLAQLVVGATIQPSPEPALGASGAIFGVLLCYGMSFPRRTLMLIFPPIPMPAWLFVTFYGVMELFYGVSGREPGVAHFAHLGGMAAGYALILYWRARGPRGRRY